MGENVLRGQVKAFEKGRDRSLEKMAAPTLFDRLDVISTNYTAAPVNGSSVKQGDSSVKQGDILQGYVSADGQCVNLAEGQRPKRQPFEKGFICKYAIQNVRTESL